MAYKNYTVKKGDSLWKIANDHRVTIASLRKANASIAKTDLIHPGDILKIPVSDSSEKAPNKHERIGKQFETAMKDVQNLPSVKKLVELLEG